MLESSNSESFMIISKMRQKLIGSLRTMPSMIFLNGILNTIRNNGIGKNKKLRRNTGAALSRPCYYASVTLYLPPTTTGSHPLLIRIQVSPL